MPEEIRIDLQVATPTRIAAYIRGGDAHFSVDRAVAERLFASVPGGAEAFRVAAQISEAFLARAMQYLVAEAGLRQFLVTGVFLSGEANVHELAQAIAPDSRTVYLLVDPVMLAHAHELLPSRTKGATAYVQAKLRDADGILKQASATLDLSQPVTVIMPANLAYVRSIARAGEIVHGLMSPLPAGSHLVLMHHASDLFVEEVADLYRAFDEVAAEGRSWVVTPRNHAEVTGLLLNLELIEPGLVAISDWWRPPAARPEPAHLPMYVAIGRKTHRET